MPKKIVYNNKLWREAQKTEVQSNKDYSDLFYSVEAKLKEFYRRSSTYRLSKLNSVELRRFKKLLEKLKDLAKLTEDEVALARVNKLLNRNSISREDAFITELEYEVLDTTNTLIESIDELLTKGTVENTNLTVLLVKSLAPKTFKTKDVKLSDKELKEIMQHEFAGAKYSNFLLRRKQILTSDVIRAVIKDLRTGRGVSNTLRTVRKLIKRQKSYTRTLIRNQMSYVMNLAAKKVYEKTGVERYQYQAVVDGRTTAICLSLNGNIYKVSEGIPGVNMPPMSPPLHPCRSFITPYFGE